MKADQLDRALHEKFVSQGEPLVFWNDSNSELVDYVGGGLGEPCNGRQRGVAHV